VTDRDGPSAPLAAVVNETLAARLWPGTDPIGRTLRVAGEEARYAVVGVVGDGKYRTLGEAPRPFLYRAIGQAHDGGADTGEITTGTQTLVVRAPGSVAATQVELRRLLRRLDPRVALTRLGPLEDALGVALFLPRVAAVLFAVLGLLGLALAALGVYGLMAFATTQRTKEFGVRLALGATPRGVLMHVMRDGLVLAGIGLAVGLAAAMAAARAMRQMLFGISPFDPVTFAAMGLGLLAVAALASFVPARRAMQVDPIVTLSR
jgi:hypothetical protein